MDKQELIDKAIEDLKGVLPEDGMYLLLCKQSVDEYKAGQYAAGNSARPHESYWDVICTTEKFTTRASELGWINGFQWGVEYPTNGKKPDLPDYVYVDVKCHSIKNEWKGYTDLKVSGVCWCNPGRYEVPAVSFRIIDSRYKPKEPESHGKPSVDGGTNTTEFGKKEFTQDYSAIADAVKSLPDNSWHERGELPPVGAMVTAGKDKRQCEVKCHLKNCRAAVEYENAELGIYEPRDFRPIKTEREKFVEAAYKAAYFTTSCKVSLGKLYDAGFKAPDEKSSS